MRGADAWPVARGPQAEIDLTDLDRFTAGFPHEIFAWLREHAPVWFHPPTPHTPDGEGFWVLSRYGDIERAACDASSFSSHTGGGRSGGGTILEDLPSGFAAGVLLNMMEDPRHQRLRRLVAPVVSPRMLRTMEAELRKLTRAILASVVPRGTCDLVTEVAAELPLQSIASLLGVPQEDRHRLFE